MKWYFFVIQGVGLRSPSLVRRSSGTITWEKMVSNSLFEILSKDVNFVAVLCSENQSLIYLIPKNYGVFLFYLHYILISGTGGDGGDVAMTMMILV